jgi:hypothetical protein
MNDNASLCIEETHRETQRTLHGIGKRASSVWGRLGRTLVVVLGKSVFRDEPELREIK